ncbi:FAD-binding oxidoreductase [Formosa sediminum]|uniref:FAD-binding oxidoreductase n=1 Tax=Formosa sediminum TaxID=2594004 RepID=A0A516GMK7_9FLAO|nr:FAD-dependent oxidoreductase [Formosa sediminum]QDO92766.1 FAD-binding oxidoreductase [Formosa sediminum]
MKEVDYIIVGCGLAGISFIEEIKRNNGSVLVFDNHSQNSSTVAGGVYNPVVLKRFTSVWKAKEQLAIALPFYQTLEDKLGVKLDYKTSVYRRFLSSEEQNDWFAASDKPNVGEFISTKLIKNTTAAIDAKFGYGEVFDSGRIDTAQLISAYKIYLQKQEELDTSDFQYNTLKIENSGFIYNTVKAKHIVFAEGFGIKKNPFFNILPMVGAKGELLVIHAPDLKMSCILKTSVFLIPLGDDLYKVGATYQWTDKTDETTEAGKTELLDKLKSFLKCDFTVVKHLAGVRPTVKDRRPIVGEHLEHKHMYVLNGLGTRGVLIGPYVAKQLYNVIEHGGNLDPDINITRFY